MSWFALGFWGVAQQVEQATVNRFVTGSEHGPSTSRELAERIIEIEGKDCRDRRLMNDIVKRIGKALRQMRDTGIVTRTAEKVRGEYVWSLAGATT